MKAARFILGVLLAIMLIVVFDLIKGSKADETAHYNGLKKINGKNKKRPTSCYYFISPCPNSYIVTFS